MLRSLFLSVMMDITDKFPEVIGGFVFCFLGFVLTASAVEMMNGILQSLVLIGSVAVSIFTVIYLRKKIKNLK